MPTPAFWLKIFGIDLKRAWTALRDLPRYRDERRRFRQAMDGSFAWGRELPMLEERSASSGSLGAYFHQDLLVASWVHQDNPRRHVDVGSRIDGFIGHLAVFREVEVLDIRPQPREIPNVVFQQLDLMADLPAEWTDCTDSLSCLHTIEHFGLGRYGDTIDPAGHLKGLDQLKRMVAPGGLFYLSTPIGPQRVEFNAHRIFAAETVIGWFLEGWEIERFAYLDDAETLHTGIDLTTADIANHFGCHTGLALLAARKI
jgi:SAM-dependent methyltransferase